jgi:hypothetical protein
VRQRAQHVQADQYSQPIGRQRMQLPHPVRQLVAFRYQRRQREEPEAVGHVSGRIGLQPPEQRDGEHQHIEQVMDGLFGKISRRAGRVGRGRQAAPHAQPVREADQRQPEDGDADRLVQREQVLAVVEQPADNQVADQRDGQQPVQQADRERIAGNLASCPSSAS